MKVYFKDMVLEAFDKNKDYQKEIMEEFVNDSLIRKYLKKFSSQTNKKYPNSPKFNYEVPYFVYDDDKIIGYLYTFRPDSENTVDLHYAVHPDYRGQHYGTIILKQSSEALFETFELVERIRLVIQSKNYISRRAASKAGFIDDGTINFYKTR